MPDETAEIGVKLVASDAAKKVTEDLKNELQQTNKVVEQTNAKLAETGKKGGFSLGELIKGNVIAQKATESLGGAAAALAGPYGVALEAVDLVKEALTGSYEMAKKLGEASLEAANHALKETQAMAGTFSLFDKGKHDFGELRNYAESVHEELEKVGIQAGVSGDKMTEMYNAIIDRGGVSSEKAKDLASNMAMVGKLVRGGPDSLAQGFSMMEMGIVRAKNPLVQLIAATQTLHGNARSVAQQMMHMTPTRQMELAEKAIAKQAEMMRKGGAAGELENLDTLKTSFEGIREQALQAIGKPLLEKIIPHLVAVKNFLVENGEKIEGVAENVGEKLGTLIDWVADATGGIYDAVHENWDDIVTTTKDLLSPLTAVWDYIHEHQSAIGRFFKEVTGDVVSAYKWIDKAMREVGEDLLKVIKAIPVVGKKVAGAQAESIAENRTFTRGVGSEADEMVAKQIAAYKKVAAEAGKSNAEIEKTVANIRGWHEQAEKEGMDAVKSLKGEHFQEFGDYMSRAMRKNDDGALEFGIKVLNNSDLGKKALVEGAMHVEGGFDHFISVVREKSPELAKQLKEMANTIKKEGGIKGIGPMINFNNNTFNIHQDFKDDPDRMMIAFRQDIVKSAVSRRQARLGTVFGL